MSSYTESPARLPGWTLIRNVDTKSARYRSPDGTEVGPWAYKTSQKEYERTGIVPRTPVGNRWQAYQKERPISSNEKHSSSTAHVEIDLPDSDESLVVELPEPKSNSSRKKSGAYTSKEIAEGMQTILVIVTSIIAMALSLREAQMTEMEVKTISIPAGNILEKSRFNKAVGDLIVGKSDWLTLGYASYMYVDRVARSARERVRNDQSTGAFRSSQEQGRAGSNGAGPSGPGVSLRPAPQGLRVFTGNN